MEKEKRAKDADAARAAVRRETAQRCAEIARNEDMSDMTDESAVAIRITAAITKEFGPWE